MLNLPCGLSVTGWQLSQEPQPQFTTSTLASLCSLQGSAWQSCRAGLAAQSGASALAPAAEYTITGTPPHNTPAAQIRDYNAGCLSAVLRSYSRATTFNLPAQTALQNHIQLEHKIYFLLNLFLLFLKISFTASSHNS